MAHLIHPRLELAQCRSGCNITLGIPSCFKCGLHGACAFKRHAAPLKLVNEGLQVTLLHGHLLNLLRIHIAADGALEHRHDSSRGGWVFNLEGLPSQLHKQRCPLKAEGLDVCGIL